MTTVILNYSQSLIEVIINGLKNTLKGVMIGYMIARQTQANRYVADQSVKYGEYRQEEYWVLLNDLNQKTIDQIHKEFDK